MPCCRECKNWNYGHGPDPRAPHDEGLCVVAGVEMRRTLPDQFACGPDFVFDMARQRRLENALREADVRRKLRPQKKDPRQYNLFEI